ncbi:minor tail protein [Arthrobacter phage Bolt007]|uniref:Minor tail protein n=1 Tax=Arthrobacter phage Bolt007 TaxID=3017297 RepID=A0AA49E4W1_9CAUD|nr:minor tail protein [Arthrobacter phage Bolt007]
MIYRGRVVEPLPGQRAWVVVPSLAGQDPIEVPAVPYDLSAGEGVLVGDLSTRGADLVVLGRENELQRFPEWGDLVGVPAEFPPAPHSHDWADVSGKPATYPPSAHGHAWGEISGAPATYPPSAHTHDWTTGITGKPAVYPPQGHVHGVTDISDSTVIGRSLVISQTGAQARTAIGAMDAARTFTKADVGLSAVDNTADVDKALSNAAVAALANKSDSGHTHSYSSIAGIDPAPVGIAYANGWTNFNDGATYAKLRSIQGAPGSITLSGMPKPGTISEGIQIGTVAAAHFPTRDQYMHCVARTTVPSNVPCLLVVRGGNGHVEVFGAPSTTSYLCIGSAYVLNGG